MSRPHMRDPKLERFWRTTLAKWAKSQLNIRDFCHRHKLGESAFYFWRRQIAARDSAPVAWPTALPKSAVPARRSLPPTRTTRSRACRTTKPTPQPSFVALRVVADTPLESVLRSGHVLRVPPGYDADHLRTVVAALEAPSC